MKKASGMLLLLYSFYNTYAKLYIGTDYSLNIKDSIPFQAEKKDSLVSLYIKDITTVYNSDQISNVKVVVLSSSLSKSPQASFTKTIKKAKNKKVEKRSLKLISKQRIYISENTNSNVVFNGESRDIAIVITNNTFKEKQGIVQNKQKVFALYNNNIFPKQPIKIVVLESAYLMGIQIRPPPSFKYSLY
ncbi:hypothetical protein CLU97_2440 [Chryseobacterium sp. 7]|uniref:hypothetical protein n=1 Tax=Chryseobacterium sp. 7 TaxID=2035214 RepID=UPI000EB0738E|nr:hypothetical protein [Chryseobacterium sp. 7]RLJ32969.1 hypothetical protein CLU97_2440 [Chryseobacterium sp. 7]